MIYFIPLLILFVFLAFITIWQNMRIDELEGRCNMLEAKYRNSVDMFRETVEENHDLKWSQDMRQISIEGVKEHLDAEVERLEDRIDYLYNTGMQHKEVLQLLADELGKEVEKVDELQLKDKEEDEV